MSFLILQIPESLKLYITAPAVKCTHYPAVSDDGLALKKHPLFFLQSGSSFFCCCFCGGNSLIRFWMLHQWQKIRISEPLKVNLTEAALHQLLQKLSQSHSKTVQANKRHYREAQEHRRSCPLDLVVNCEHLLDYVESGKSCGGRDNGRLKLNSKKLRASHPPVLLSADVPPA